MKTNAEHARAWRLKNVEHVRAYRKLNRAKRRKQLRRWKARNPDKVRELRKSAAKQSALYGRSWRARNVERVKEYHKKRPRELQNKARAKHRKKYPEKEVARVELAAALSLGTITKPNSCSKCNAKCRPEGHHPDYSKPLEVIWLCKKCHVLIHYGP